MTITPKTTVHTLLKEYPFLLDFLAGYHPEFKKLTNPVLRRTVGRMATLDAVAEQGNVPLNQLMLDIAAEIEAKTGSRPEIADKPRRRQHRPGASRGAARDRQGPPRRQVRGRGQAALRGADQGRRGRRRSPPWSRSSSRAACPTPRSSASATCTCRSSPTRSRGTSPSRRRPATPSTPSSARTRRCCRSRPRCARSRRRSASRRCARSGSASSPRSPAILDRLLEVDKHYLRKENQLFPFLEKHGVEGPSKVMWAIHDDIRALLKQARAALADDDAALAVQHGPAVAQDGRRHGDQGGEGPLPHGDRHADRRRVARDPRRRGRDRLRAHRRRAAVAGGGERPAAAGGAAAAAGPAAAASRRHPAHDRRPHRRAARPDAHRPARRHQLRRRERRGALLQRGRAHLPALARRDRPQGAELPPAGERAQGAGDRRRLPRRREGRRRVLDRDAAASSCTSATSPCATPPARTAAPSRWSRT